MTDGAPTDLAELYALDPREFTVRRDELAMQARKAGDKDAAKQLKALRRPTVPAWALNRVAHADGPLIDDLLAAAGDAQGAQAKAVGGGSGDGLRDALAGRRRAIAAVVKRAGEMLAGSGRAPDAHERDVEMFLTAAAADARLAGALRRGQLADLDPGAASPDDLLASLSASLPDAATGGDAPQRASPPKPDPAIAAAEAALAEAREVAQAADGRVSDAAARVAAAKAAAERAAAELRAAKTTLAEVEREQAQTRRDTKAAERRLADLGGGR